ncbi:MAG: hypothetical protein A3H50_03530 [Candidatus Levybacteria bacterium RIFCSPLOWO2_02_FULL_37_10]|nr:MAG: hypothetical protein A2860_02395 [Candidatus Levybacteria bacterium RIFCSPHIGHO2_01_FULL_37_33]OGH15806.1 MAG: hypothetical protein A3C97_01000 [Candidatus Levybacteria bacterium RIFCSPHIGHO2_02_FULL_37_11]OGH43129.1 MAG: hypothetical protein A3H50_03530 [Candidatus Levybacteria bacterium RIFCSPLOWO2_02_FULL_37_10]
MKSTQPQLLKVSKDNEDEKLQKSRGFELKTKNNYRLDEVVSALQKSIRRGQEERALYWAYEMIHGGYIGYFWRRISVIVVEDFGLADSFAPVLINSLAQLNERVNRNGYVETFHPTMAVLYLCRSPKSREIDHANDWLDRKREMGWREEIETQDLDEHNLRGRERIKQMEGNYQRNKDEVFYYESILLNNHVSIADDKYKKLVWELRKLDKKKMHNKYEPK